MKQDCASRVAPQLRMRRIFGDRNPQKRYERTWLHLALKKEGKVCTSNRQKKSRLCSFLSVLLPIQAPRVFARKQTTIKVLATLPCTSVSDERCLLGLRQVCCLFIWASLFAVRKQVVRTAALTGTAKWKQHLDRGSNSRRSGYRYHWLPAPSSTVVLQAKHYLLCLLAL